MSAPTGTNQQNAPPAAPSQSNRPNQGSRKNKMSNKNKRIKKANAAALKLRSAAAQKLRSAAGPKLRSADPLPNDTDITSIRARLASGGTATDLAEEAYRLCHINASLRRDLAAAKAAPFTTDNAAARIKARLDDNATAQDMAEEAYRMCRVHAHVKKDKLRVQAELRSVRQQVAVQDDALAEMREEYPEMRRVLGRAFGLLRSRGVDVPRDLGEAFEAVMQGERRRRGVGKRHLPKPAKVVQVEKEVEGGGKKTPFLLHMQNGRVYDLERPLAEQDSDGEEDEEDEDEEEEDESEPPVASRKRKGDEMEESVAKKARVESELEDGEVDE